MFRPSFVIALAAAFVVTSLPGRAQERDRAGSPEQYKWDLTPLYPTDQAWRTAKDRAQTSITELARFKGKLAASGGGLADALDRMFETSKTLSRLSSYASMLADQDTR